MDNTWSEYVEALHSTSLIVAQFLATPIMGASTDNVDGEEPS